MCGVDPATDANFNEAVKQHYIQGGWLTAAQIKALKAKLNPSNGPGTGVEEVSHQTSAVRKVMRDGMLYIVKDGKMYDSRGERVE